MESINRVDVYLYIVYGLFSFVNFPVASPQKHTKTASVANYLPYNKKMNQYELNSKAIFTF